MESVNAGHSTSFASFPRHQPQVACIGKRDVRFGKRGLLHEQRPGSMRAESTNEESDDGEQADEGILHKHQPEMKCRSTRQLRLAAELRKKQELKPLKHGGTDAPEING